MQIRVAKAASDAAAATGAGIRVALLLPCFFGCFFCTADSSTSTKSSSSNGGGGSGGGGGGGGGGSAHQQLQQPPERTDDVHERLREVLAATHADEMSSGSWKIVTIQNVPLAGGFAQMTTLQHDIVQDATGKISDEDSEALARMIEAIAKPSAADMTGGGLWMSALLLSRFLSSSWGRHFVQGRSCIELGAGTGAVSIAASQVGASRVVATDGNAVMLTLADANARLNLQPAQLSRFEVSRYLWGEAVSNQHNFRFQTVLISDALYSRDTAPALLSAVEAVCDEASCDVLIAMQTRPGLADIARDGHHATQRGLKLPEYQLRFCYNRMKNPSVSTRFHFLGVLTF